MSQAFSGVDSEPYTTQPGVPVELSTVDAAGLARACLDRKQACAGLRPRTSGQLPHL